MPPAVAVCSLITSWPPGKEIVWFGAPLTSTGTPSSVRLPRTELPVALPAAASYRRGRGRQGQAPELRRAGYGPRQQAGHEHGGTGGGAQERVRVTHLSSLVWDEPRHQRRCGLHPARHRIVHSDYASPPFGLSLPLGGEAGPTARTDPPKDSRACRSPRRKGAEGRHHLPSFFCLSRLSRAGGGG